MFKQYKKIIYSLLLISCCFLFFTQTVQPALAIDLPTIVPECAASGDCTLDDFIQVFVNISELILGLVGAVALMFFVYGGVVLLTSGGNSDKIKKGQEILKQTVIALIIILGAWLIIRFVQEMIGLKSTYYLENLEDL